MADHAWCSDPARDEAVRATENGRLDPLPTLEEAIAAVSPLPGRVDGTHWADWDRLRAERDAARRERDELRTECERLRGKVAAMEGQSRMDIEREIAVEEAWESCDIRQHWPDDEPGTSHRYAESMRQEIVRLRARVSDLEGQLESVACRAATAENRVAELEAAPVASRWRMLKVGETVEPGDEMTDDLFMPWCDAGPCVGKQVVSGVIAYRRRVEAPAASGAANSPGSPESSEPDAWGLMRNGKVDAVTYLLRSSAELATEGFGGTVVPLYTSQPPARGWLTEEERGSLWYAIEGLREAASRRNNGHARTLEGLLDRSTPPEVEGLPEKLFWSIGEPEPHWPTVKAVNDVIDKCRAALAAGGVSVKEAR